jgi:hypothetical protein
MTETKALQNKNKPYLDNKLDIQGHKILIKVFKHQQQIYNSQIKNINNK